MSDLERELESELHRVLDPVASLPIPARRAPQSRGPMKTLLGGAGAALAVKVLSGVAVAAAAVTVAGAATTGSLNPTVWGNQWGQQVKQQVDTCKDQLAQGQHGIGECVSSFANQHGRAVASSARQHGNGSGDGSSKSKDNNGNGNGNGHGSAKPKDATPGSDSTEQTGPPTHPTPRAAPGP